MTSITFDTLKLADKLSEAGFTRQQAESVIRVMTEAQSELVTRSDLHQELAPMRTDLAVLKWMVGFNLAFTTALLWKILL